MSSSRKKSASSEPTFVPPKSFWPKGPGIKPGTFRFRQHKHQFAAFAYTYSIKHSGMDPKYKKAYEERLSLIGNPKEKENYFHFLHYAEHILVPEIGPKSQGAYGELLWMEGNPEAIIWLEKSSANSRHLGLLGNIYLHGECGVVQDKSRARALFDRALKVAVKGEEDSSVEHIKKLIKKMDVEAKSSLSVKASVAPAAASTPTPTAAPLPLPTAPAPLVSPMLAPKAESAPVSLSSVPKKESKEKPKKSKKPKKKKPATETYMDGKESTVTSTETCKNPRTSKYYETVKPMRSKLTNLIEKLHRYRNNPLYISFKSEIEELIRRVEFSSWANPDDKAEFLNFKVDAERLIKDGEDLITRIRTALASGELSHESKEEKVVLRPGQLRGTLFSGESKRTGGASSSSASLATTGTSVSLPSKASTTPSPYRGRVAEVSRFSFAREVKNSVEDLSEISCPGCMRSTNQS